MSVELFKKKYPSLRVFESSAKQVGDKWFFLAVRDEEKLLAIGSQDFTLNPLNEQTVKLLRDTFPWLHPTVCGIRNSFGFGDRLGIATPGHIQALGDKDFFPVFAQQSVRELERTERTFSDVLNDAAIGCFQKGYTGKFGADADHIKDIKHLEDALKAGFTFFTIDPSGTIPKEPEKEQITQDKWLQYESKYLDKKIQVGEQEFVFTKESLRELVLIYDAALDFIQSCYLFLKNGSTSFDFEVSVDETSYPTTPLAHIFIVDQLQKRKIDFQNLALRFPGKFEKGIDYKGNIDELKESLTIHLGIREKLGTYKISLHSGSDKFSIYSSFREILGSNFHVKTSGTSWIEAIHAIAEINRPFFYTILQRAIDDFAENAASYEISANPQQVDLKQLEDKTTEEIFNDADIRQIIHISYGSIISGKDSMGHYEFKEKLFEMLSKNERLYNNLLEKHLGKHLGLLT